MLKRQLFSRRGTTRKVDFRPDAAPKSPYAQLRRLEAYLEQKNAGADDLVDCPTALDYLREYTYRKIFTGTTHEEYMGLPDEVVDWLIAVHETESEHFQSRRNQEKRN